MTPTESPQRQIRNPASGMIVFCFGLFLGGPSPNNSEGSHRSLMRKPLLFLPGPMQVPDPVRVAGDRPLFSHRSPQMLELLGRLETGCRPLFGTKGDVVFLAASGTGAMESALVNLTSPGDEIIVVVGGTFAARWADIGKAYGLAVRTADVEWRRG